MEHIKILENFQEIVVETPVDIIIRQIRDLIKSGQLNPGDKLPPERKLAEKMGIGRSYIRDAIRKLEFYGILKTLPQSGTIVAGIGITALEGLISDVLKLEDSDFGSLVETRVLLETRLASLAAQRRTEEDINIIERALSAYEKKIKKGLPAVEEDLMFHIKIAKASKNAVLESLMLIITPDIVHSFNKLNVCTDERSLRALEEHKLILKHIMNQDETGAALAMQEHLRDVLEYSQQHHPIIPNSKL